MEKKSLKKTNEGFTLLEVIIAMSIMLISFSSILAVESGSINATTRAKQMNVVSMLARNLMVDTEFKIEGKTFDEVKKEDSGTFPSPYQDYRWKTEVKELEFPSLGGGGGDQIAEMVTKAVTNYLSKAVREVNVTVLWKRGPKDQTFSVSTYWVNLNHELSITP